MENSQFSINLSTVDKKAKQNFLLAKSIEQHQDIKQELLEDIEITNETKQRNIFADPVNQQLCKHDPNIGPKIENNKIVRRSIVGKPELFKIKQDKNKSIETERHKKFSLFKQTTSTFRHTHIHTQPYSTGEELQQKINLLEKQLFDNSQRVEQQNDNLPFELRQQIYRDKRALDYYNKLEKEQNDILTQLSRRTNRDPSKSVMVDLYRYRKKVEYSSTNDNLRQLSDNRRISIYEFDQDNSNCVPLLFTSDQQEVIRKPSIMSQDETTQSILKGMGDDQAYNSFTTNEYLQEQYQKYKQFVQDKVMVNPDELIVVGQNKFQTESKIDPYGKYQLYEIEKDKEEIYAENYQKQYKLKYK